MILSSYISNIVHENKTSTNDNISMKLIASRTAQTGRQQDIHETDADFLENSYRAALYASEKLGWKRIKCYDGGKPLSREHIHELILDALGY